MSQTKKSHSKTTKDHAAAPATQDEDELKDASVLNEKKIIDVDAALEPALIEDKEDEDLPVTPEDTDDPADELSLDDEELNPFGDKWEQ